MKVDDAVKTDVYKHIKASELASAVTGVIRKTKRPRDSKKEDVVISVLSNFNGQIQVCTVNVNIYVADLVNKGQPEENSKRCRELSEIAARVLEVFRGDNFRAVLESQHVYEVVGADEHVINNRIEYKQLNE